MGIVDQFHDPAFASLYHQIKERPALETFVKSASLEAGGDEQLPHSAFAWPVERRFPIHTPEHAALSYSYAKTASVPQPVLSAIEEALEVYGVDKEIFTEQEKVASAQTYLLPDLNLFPANSAAEVKYSQERLLESLTKLDLENRTEACVNLVKAAAVHGVSVQVELQKLAGLVVSDLTQTRDWVLARTTKLAEDSPFRKAYATLAQGLDKATESADRPTLMKLASTIAELDSESGLDRHYDRRLPDAVRTVFNTEKIASATVDINGALIPLSKIAALPASFWEDLGGSELSNEIAPGGVVDVSKVAEIVETLPLDLKVILRKQLRA